VALHRALSEEHSLCDLAIRLTGDRAPQDFALAVGECGAVYGVPQHHGEGAKASGDRAYSRRKRVLELRCDDDRVGPRPDRPPRSQWAAFGRDDQDRGVMAKRPGTCATQLNDIRTLVPARRLTEVAGVRVRCQDMTWRWDGR
jgi:hypothetical protein